MKAWRVHGKGVAAWLAAYAWVPGAWAAIVPIPPFTGQFSDTFNSYPLGARPALNVLQTQATIRNLTDGGSIKIELSSSLNGDLVTPISGRMLGQLGIAEWTFAEPMRRFGAYLENNSGADHATFSFFGAGVPGQRRRARAGRRPAVDLERLGFVRAFRTDRGRGQRPHQRVHLV